MIYTPIRSYPKANWISNRWFLEDNPNLEVFLEKFNITVLIPQSFRQIPPEVLVLSIGFPIGNSFLLLAIYPLGYSLVAVYQLSQEDSQRVLATLVLEDLFTSHEI